MRIKDAGPSGLTSSLIAGALLALSPAPGAPSDGEPRIPFERLRLANGLEVILHEDHRTPTVAVDVWYRVGSRDELPGQRGFAHLFEHLMFQGSKHVPEGRHFALLQRAGVSTVNGHTTADRSGYFEVVPSNQIELALWLESDRMGFLLDRPSFQQAVDSQCDAIATERRESIENRPLGAVLDIQRAALYPSGHPYAHPVMGSMKELSAASLDDVRRFFRRWYAPGNATLVVAGDFDPARLKQLVDKYFAPLPGGPPIARSPGHPIPRLAGEKRIAMEANVQRPQIFVTYHSPARHRAGDHELDLLASILAGGKSSRLHRRLVHEQKIAQSVSAAQNGQALAGSFELAATAMSARGLPEILRAIDEEIEKVRSQPVLAGEIEGVVNLREASVLRGLESVLGRAEQLQAYNLLTGDPGFIGEDLRRYRAVDGAALQRCAQQFLDPQARLVLTVDSNPDAPIMGRVKNR